MVGTPPPRRAGEGVSLAGLRVKQAPGPVGGYWLTLDDSHGMSMLVFDDRTQGEQMTKTLAVPTDAPVTIESV